MRSRATYWILLCLLCLAGAWFLWPRHGQPWSKKVVATPILVTTHSASTAPNFLIVSTNNARAAAAKTNRFAYRLSNTSKSIGELEHDRHAILLENAFIDTGASLNLAIPKKMQAQGDPGAYIVQARGPIDNSFRAMLTSAGAKIVSYIPNDAFLVNATAAVANQIAANGFAVIPYEPYYKVSPQLASAVMGQDTLPADPVFTLGLFPGQEAAAIAQLTSAGWQVVSQSGDIIKVQWTRPSAIDWTPLAQLAQVHIVELSHQRAAANDLSRVTLGISVDTVTNATYMNLSGSNVVVEVNDSGIDQTHPDFSIGENAESGGAAAIAPGAGRVFGVSPLSLVDTNGHGTHVAGIIAGNGWASYTVTNTPQGSVTNADFRGKAPAATLFSFAVLDNAGILDIPDIALQQAPLLTNALISNNSWGYEGDTEYDLAAASYDAAVRDALPAVTGSSPVLFVFSAGNDGGGDDNGGNGGADTISSPATAKNVISVGAIEQLRNITNVVTDAEGNSNAVWQLETDTGSQVAGYSSRGNVGVGTEGTFGRFKPDVVAPGTFVISTRSQQWDQGAYYDVTNYTDNEYTGQLVNSNTLQYYSLTVPENAVGVVIQVIPNNLSPTPFPTNMLIYVSLNNFPDPTDPTTYDFVTSNNVVTIPPDGGAGYIQTIENATFNFAVADGSTTPVNYDLTTEIITTNDNGNYFEVLSNLNNTLAPWYRYESGTSMSAAAVSGVLALMQDYFTNTLHTIPSPALLKAMLINGARVTGNYKFAVTNTINFQGWGLPNLPSILPPGITNAPLVGCSSFFADQSVSNTLATGDNHNYTVAITNTSAQILPLRVTLVWTDPPGDPSAAIKLVNNLDLVITNLATGDVYYGNNFALSGNPPYSVPWLTNSPPNPDAINNVENIFLAPLLAGNYSVTVIARDVNVNAVTEQTNNSAGAFAPNVVQDYALVISCGEGEVTNAITVTDNGIVSNPTSAQQITIADVATNGLATNGTSGLFMNQMAGANSPLLGTNMVGFGTNSVYDTNALVTVGMTNQWHFYAVSNSTAFANAAFLTFFSETLSIPRLGVFADSAADATRPDADIDLYVSTDSGLTNLDPMVISNCVNGTQVGASVGSTFSGASLGRGGTEFIADTNSQAGEIYYVGVKSEDQESAEFDFLPIFSQAPFSEVNPLTGAQTVNGLLVPQNIPDGSPAHPGTAYIFGLALYPMELSDVVVSDTIFHQNFGDLIGTLNHNGVTDVLNNHDSLGNPPGPYNFIYDDSGQGVAGSQPSDGPGSLNSYVGTEGVGPWILTEVDDALTQTGTVTAFSLVLQPHQDLGGGVTLTIQPLTWFYDYVDVTAGFTNLIITATNLPPTATPPLQMFTRFGAEPTLTNYDQTASLTNGVLPGPGNAITNGPPLPPGRYFVGIYNPSSTAQQVLLQATLGGAASAISPTDYSGGQTAIPDDATVSTATIQVTNIPTTATIASVNVGIVVNHPRISDLTFTLVSPTGQTVLLMENRGGTTTNGAGDLFITTNSFAPIVANGGPTPQTNFLNVGEPSGSLTINYDMYNVPDQMTVYDGTNSGTFTTNSSNPFLLWNTGLVSGPGTITVPFSGTSTYVTIIMNQFTNPSSSTAWTYTVGGAQTNFNYLTFTEDTNLTTTPIKFAVPPYVLTDQGTNYILSDFEVATNNTVATNADYFAPTNIYDANDGWFLPTNLFVLTNALVSGTNIVGTNSIILSNNQVSVVTDPANAQDGSNFLALANGTITRPISMTVGRQFSLSFAYRGPGISGWWRGEGNATDSSDPENNGNNGELIGRFNFPAGEVGQAFEMEDAGNEFQFAGTNTYVQIHQTPFFKQVVSGSNDTVTLETSSLNVGAGSGLTVEGWISPTNVSFQQPLVEWLARAQATNADTNLVIQAGPFLDPATGHYYYLLGSTNWTTSETWATQLGGHLVTVDTANEQNWIYDTFANYGGTNRNLWIGLNDVANPAPPIFTWTSLAPVVYTNWLTGEPTNCDGNEFYTAMLGSTNGQPGLWILASDTGVNCSGIPPTNKFYGVVEVNDIQTNGVQFWISVTNSPGTTNSLVSSNGCLYANLIDITNGWHEIFSAPGLIQSNVFQHVALTYNTNSGVANLYYNGTNVATTNFGVPFMPKTTGDVLLGKDMSRLTNNFYGGEMDEMSIYARALSASEIAAIYRISAFTTNRNIGKFDPTIPPAEGLAEAQVSLGGTTNIIYGVNNQWQEQSFSFTATTNSLPMQISGIEPGILLDTFTVSEAPLGNLYYLPEQSLASLDETPAYGTWTLQVWDNRAGAYITNAEQLVSWQLQVVLDTNTPTYTPLNPQQPGTVTVPPGQIIYLSVTVPTWAKFATNILDSATLPVDLLFNQTNPPTGNVPPDTELLAASTNGIGVPVLAANPPSTPPLLPGQTYYLGVRNTNSVSVTAVVEVDYDITGLTNSVPYTGLLNTNDSVRYFSYTVSSNAVEATFQLLQLSSNADLVLSKGPPLPTLFSDAYGSFNAGNVDENIYVLTNSAPVPLSPGTWYLGVFKRDPLTVRYAVLAKELDATGALTNAWTTIDLTNNVPFYFTAGPGAALTNFFRFTVTNFPPSVRFELFNQSGNGDLTVQTNAPPLAPPFFQSSQQPGRANELIFVATNSALSGLTNSTLTNLNAQWYLGVPNHESNSITYFILASLGTNGVFPTFPGAEGAGAGTLGGGSLFTPGYTNDTVYHVTSLGDSGLGTLRDAVSSTNRTIVFDVSGTINLLSPLVITNSYLTIAGQTAPGGITVAGNMTTVQSAHDVIIRYLRFRPNEMAINPVVWSNGFEGGIGSPTIFSGNYFAGWHVDRGSIDWLTNGYGAAPGLTPYQGNYFIDLDGSNAGEISTNIPTVSGVTYTLDFAYTKNPISGATPTPSAQVLINGNPLATVTVNFANSIASLNWQTTSFVFTATSPSTKIAFNSGDLNSSDGGVFLDAVSVATNAPNNPGDSLQFTNALNVIADHVSTSWSSNNLVSVLNSSNITVQWSIMADSLYITNNPHGFGSLLRYGQGALSFHHNLYADNYSASPRLGDNLSLDFVNNVIYDWGIHSGYSGTNDLLDNPNGFTNQLNYVCNYLIAGPDTAYYSTNDSQTNIAFWGGTTNTWIFQTNNFIDSDTNGILNGANTGWGMFTNLYTKTNGPFMLPPVDTDEAFLAYEKVLDFAGTALFARDFVDDNIVLGVRNQNGRIISTPPGIVAWWPGETNANDIVGTNNGTPTSITYTNGEVRQAFVFNGSTSVIKAPASPSLNVGLDKGFTMELWVEPVDIYTRTIQCLLEWNNNSGDSGIGTHMFLSVLNPGDLYANIIDTSGTAHVIDSAANLMTTNTLQHVALTYDKATGIAVLYRNGIAVATQSFGSFTPQTSYDFYFGERPSGSFSPGYYKGLEDEVSLYNYALSSNEIAAIYNAGSAGKYARNMPPPLDSDQDGIPDYWEMTFTPANVYVPSNNNDRDGDGYSDLEEYLNWLAAPHALTLTNTPVGVDLYKLAGDTGNLSFSVSNGVNGTVYLTNVLGTVTNTGPYSNSFAIFTPTNASYSGYAAFDFYVTNNDTVAYFGPVTVSVVVSAVPVLTGRIIPLTNAVPFVNTSQTAATGLDYYVYDVSTNAIGVEFQILNASSNVILYATYGLPLPPAPGYPNYSTNASVGNGTNATILVLSNSMPLSLKSGDWYLAVSNETGGPVTYTIEATEILTNNYTAPILTNNLPNLTNDELVPITVTNTATDTNVGVTLTYTVTMTIDTNAMNSLGWTNSYANTTNTAPVISTNGIITWTPSEAQGPGVYTITTVVTDNGVPTQSATNSFDVTVNEVNVAPVLPAQPNLTITVPTTLIVTNTATDSDLPPNPLGYTLTTTVSGPPGPNTPSIDTNGIITWTPALAQAGNTYTFTTVVTDSSPFAVNSTSLSATNSFTVTVLITAPPFAFTQPATAVTGTSAQLNGMATANGLPSTAWFQWGTTTNYGSQTTPVSVGTSFNVFYTNATINSLTPNVPYHFQLVVSNALGMAYGFDQILDEANVAAWGADILGAATVPSGLSNVVAIAGAYEHSLALKNNETVVAWGDNTFGQTNVPAGLNNNLVAVAGGESFSIALNNNGTVFAWGGNSFPGETNVPPGLNNVVTIASGQYSSLALKNTGTIVAWGANISGLTNVPSGLSNAVAIASGSFHNLAIKNDGTVAAWGDDSAGQTNVPTGLTNVVAISAGSFHSLALKADGTVVAWGDNSYNQTNVPAGLNNVVAVAAGGYDSLALRSDGTITAWGDNSVGQQDVPPGLTNFVAIAAGYLHSLALTPQTIASLTNIVLNYTNGVEQSNNIPPGVTYYYKINVPANADLATNILFNLNTNELVNVWFTTNSPPTTNATLLLVGSTNATSLSVLSTTSAPTNIVPGGIYYLAVQNTNSSSAFYAIEVDFHLLVSTSAPIYISSIIATNNGVTNGFLLTWFAPSNDLFQVQWNDNLGSTNWTTFINPPVVSYNTNFPANATNAQFNFFDDGSQTPPGLPPIRFYRLILLPSTNPPTPTNTVPIGSITSTNISGVPGFLLTWFAPTNDLFKVQWNNSLGSTNWQTFTNPTFVSYNTNIVPVIATNAQFNFFDDNSQTGGSSPTRFYRLILLSATNFLTLPLQTNFTVSGSTTITVTNTAIDSRTNAILTYSLTNAPAGSSINTNGIITWTNSTPPGLAARFNTVVTDDSAPPLIATNTFTIFVAPLPSITNVTMTATNVVLKWSAPTNDLFKVQWTTNLAPVITWTLFPNIITSTNGLFLFTDTNAPLLMKFYQLVLLP